MVYVDRESIPAPGPVVCGGVAATTCAAPASLRVSYVHWQLGGSLSVHVIHFIQRVETSRAYLILLSYYAM
jgi:hypothetical protein